MPRAERHVVRGGQHIAAVEAGAMHVQGTANGYGERPGNADIFAIIGNLTTSSVSRCCPTAAWRR